jgi:hypothetical protein
MASSTETRRKKQIRALLKKFQRRLDSGRGRADERTYWHYVVNECRRALKNGKY